MVSPFCVLDILHTLRVPMLLLRFRLAASSVITSKAANDNHLKTGQRRTSFRTGVSTPLLVDRASAFLSASFLDRISKHARDAAIDRAWP